MIQIINMIQYWWIPVWARPLSADRHGGRPLPPQVLDAPDATFVHQPNSLFFRKPFILSQYTTIACLPEKKFGKPAWIVRMIIRPIISQETQTELGCEVVATLLSDDQRAWVQESDLLVNTADSKALVHASGHTYYVLRIAYSVLHIAYSVKLNRSCSIFNETACHDLEIALAERMIMVPNKRFFAKRKWQIGSSPRITEEPIAVWNG